jgi:hypothetical protein
MSNYPARVYINNVYRQPTDTADNFNVTLPSQIINAKTMSINSATIPLLCYTFDSTESVFYYQAGSTVVQQVTLNLKKIYTSLTAFITDFNALLQAVTPTLTVAQDINAGDGILTITNSAGGINVIGIANKELNWQGASTYYNNCSDRLGFYNGSARALTVAPVATSFTASGPVILLRTSSIYVAVDIIAGDSYTSNSPSQSISNILFQLPVTNGNYGAIQSYFNNDFLLFSGNDLPQAIYNIAVTLYDDNFNNLSLLPSAKVLIELSFKYKDQPTILPFSKQ